MITFLISIYIIGLILTFLIDITLIHNNPIFESERKWLIIFCIWLSSPIWMLGLLGTLLKSILKKKMNYLTKILIAWITGFVILGLVVVSIGLLVGSVIDAITFFSLFYLIATIIALAGISLGYILKWLMD